MQTRETVFRYWASRFECDVSLFATPGSTVVPVEPMRNDGTLYLYRIDQHAVLRCDPLLARRISECLPDASSTLESSAARELFGSVFKHEGDHPHFYLDAADFVPTSAPSNIHMRRLAAEEYALLDPFLEQCSETDVEWADIERDNHDPVIICGFDTSQHDSPLVAYASFRTLTNYGGDPQYGDQIGDVGVLIRPDCRSHGLGRAVVSAQSRWCLDHGVVPQYQVLATHEHSYRIPVALGYRPLLTVSAFSST